MGATRSATWTARALALGAALAVTAATAADAGAQAPATGRWEGAIDLPQTELGVTVELRRAAGGVWSGDIDIPMQGARDLPLTAIAVADGSVSFSIQGVPGDPTFRGTLSSDAATIAGEFTQGGQTFPFTLTRAEAGDADAAAPARSPAEALEGFDELVRAAMDDWNVPGVAIGIVQDDRVILSKGYGFRDIERELPVTDRTLFAIGSASKAFTTMVLGMLVDDGALRWDEPVRTYLPDFRLQDEFATERMTPRDLVMHSSGLPRHDLVWYGSDLPREELYRRVRHLEPSADLRARFQYQNLMYMTAGYLAGRLTGSRWEDLVRERIFRPLGMEHSVLSVDDLQRAPDHALGYEEKDEDGAAATNGDRPDEIGERVERIPYRWIDNVGPAGSINSNVADMVEWVRLHLNGGIANGERLISEAALSEMHRPQIVVRGGILSALFEQPEMPYLMYGLGWFVQPYRGHPMIHHGGNIDGFSALVSFLPRDGVGVVVLTNLNGTALPTVLALSAYDRLLGLEEIDWSGRYRTLTDRIEASQERDEAREAIDRKRGTRPTHELEEYTGTYSHPAYGELTIERRGSGLRSSFHGLETDLEHWHYDVFRASDGPAEGMKLAFLTNLRGDIDRVSAPLETAVDPIVFEKQPPASMYDPEFLARFTGTYELMGLEATVALRGARTLTLTVPGQPTYELEPYRGTDFSVKGLKGYSVRFVIEGGTVREAIFIQPNGVFTATRKE